MSRVAKKFDYTIRLFRKSVWEDWGLSDSTNDQPLNAIERNKQLGNL